MTSVVDAWVQSAGTNRGQPVSDAGAVLSPTLAAAATFTSRWYPRSLARPRLHVFCYGDQDFTLTIEESFDGGTTVHDSESLTPTATTLPQGVRYVANLSVRPLAAHYRIKVVNGATDQTEALLQAIVSSFDA